MDWRRRNVENLDKAAFDGVGQYEIPQMEPVHLELIQGQLPVEMIGYNFASRYAQPQQAGVHFFLKDYQFSRVWTSPEVYLQMLSRFKCVCTPDFSLYTDYPVAVQLYSHYRKHWLGAWWQKNGLTVIPSISWSDEHSFDWCFDGDPVRGTVAVSSVGTQMNDNTRSLFRDGYEEMLLRLQPELILFHGDVARLRSGNIVPIPAYQKRLRKIRSGAV